MRRALWLALVLGALAVLVCTRAHAQDVYDCYNGSAEQGGNRTTTNGIGLGLSVAKGFTEAMGGTIHAEDTPGGGLTVVISLPTYQPTDKHIAELTQDHR